MERWGSRISTPPHPTILTPELLLVFKVNWVDRGAIFLPPTPNLTNCLLFS